MISQNHILEACQELEWPKHHTTYQYPSTLRSLTLTGNSEANLSYRQRWQWQREEENNVNNCAINPEIRHISIWSSEKHGVLMCTLQITWQRAPNFQVR